MDQRVSKECKVSSAYTRECCQSHIVGKYEKRKKSTNRRIHVPARVSVSSLSSPVLNRRLGALFRLSHAVEGLQD